MAGVLDSCGRHPFRTVAGANRECWLVMKLRHAVALALVIYVLLFVTVASFIASGWKHSLPAGLIMGVLSMGYAYWRLRGRYPD